MAFEVASDALQIFAKNASQWRGREVPASEVHEFRARVNAAGLHPVVSHASYLINLATTIPALRQQSLAAMADELDRHRVGDTVELRVLRGGAELVIRVTLRPLSTR